MKNTIAGIGLICATIVLVAVISISAYKNRNRANDILLVTGMASQEFESDLIVWRGSFSRTATDIHIANEQLRRDTEEVKAFIRKQNMNLTDFVFSAVRVEKVSETTVDKEGNRKEKFKGYQLTQSLSIESRNIDSVEKFSRVVTDLLQLRIEFISGQPEYYYTQLGKLKIEMIAAATKDGYTRAEKIVENAAGSLGSLRYSSLGIFQITAPNTDINPSWSGTFDTFSRKKSASVTIKLQFGLN